LDRAPEREPRSPDTPRVQAIVTALDEPWRERVEEIWGELRAVFRLQSVAATTEPHFTYHVAERYERYAVDEAISRLAASMLAFDVETHGLGVFRGEETVLFLHVTPSPALRAMHTAVWAAVDAIASDTRPIYAAHTWIPHVTLAIGDLREEQLPEIMALLGRRDYRWRMRATNVCFVPDATSRSEPWVRWELRES
jgi:2'-5' RNA ligase